MPTSKMTSLVKFCSIETGLKVLDSQSLRWSAAHLYKEPFEPNYQSTTAFTQENLLDGIVQEAVNMLFSPAGPSGRGDKIVATILRWRNEERFSSEEEARPVLKQLLGQTAEQQQINIERYMAAWRFFARTTRICSFSSKPNNMLCWQRYAENHQGIALRFACGKGTALPAPQRMVYSQSPPELTTLKEQINISYGRQPPPSSSDFLKKLLVKGKLDSKECEWRCFAADTATNGCNDQQWYSTKKFAAPELQAVYFGLATPQETISTISSLVKNKYKNAKLYQAQAQAKRYDIEFVPQYRG